MCAKSEELTPGRLFLFTATGDNMKVVLQDALQNRIFGQMEASYPNEGGGFLLGAADGDGVRIEDIIQITNQFAAEEQYHRYAMTPQDWARLEDEADARGLALVGYYHSHPDAPAIPSIYDRDHALPNFVYIITSVQQGKAVDMRVWRLQQDRAQFEANTLVVEGTV
jgi:proteasome lid subunit RPN8/RPN11